MKSGIPYGCAIAASVAAWILASSVHAQEITPVPIGNNNPSCQEAVQICSITSLVHELEISDVTTSGGSKCDEGTCTRIDSDPMLGVDFTVQWIVNSIDGSVDVDDITPPLYSQQADVPGAEAIIAEGRDGSNVYCGPNLESLDGLIAPVTNKNPTPTKITFCWASGPCKLSPDEVEEACSAYEPPPGVEGRKNWLQAHRISPQQPINMCGCDGLAAQFGVPPSTNKPIVNLVNQGTATSGTNTCQRVTIGGRAMYIGDTC